MSEEHALMTWIRLEDGFPDHPKVIAAGPLAEALFIRGLGYCSRNLTNGQLTAEVVRSLRTAVGIPPAQIAKLVSVGLWEEVEGGYRVHDYLDYQPSRADVVAQRDAIKSARSAAGRAGMASRWNNKPDNKLITDVITNAYQADNKPITPSRSRPGPVPEETINLVDPVPAGGGKRAAARAPAAVGEAEIVMFCTEFGPKLDGDQDVRERIALALCHRNAGRYTDHVKYVRNWLKGDVEKREARRGASNGRGDRAVAAQPESNGAGRIYPDDTSERFYAQHPELRPVP